MAYLDKNCLPLMGQLRFPLALHHIFLAVVLPAILPLLVLVVVYIFHFIPALSSLLPYMAISHDIVVVLVVRVIIVVPFHAPYNIFCLPGMIPDISVKT